MRPKYLASRIISEAISLSNFTGNYKKGLRILSYHSIGGSAFEDKLGIYSLSIDKFLQHLNILETIGISAISPLNITDSEFSCALTFDDGYSDSLYVVAPLLSNRNIPFTVFAVANFVEKKRDGFLSPNELKELSRFPGVTIGSHGLTHSNLRLCDNKTLKAELEDSKHYIEDLIGMPVTEFSYPYGMTDMRVRDALQNAGYEFGGCSRFDINNHGRDSLMMNRCEISRNDCNRVLEQKLRGDWDWYRWRNIDPLKLQYKINL